MAKGDIPIEKSDLCLFYKHKVARLETRFNELWELLDKLSVSRRERITLQAELKDATSQVTHLQLAVSDLQVFLLKEREENLRLATENDKLRIENYENCKAVDVLLKLSGITRSELINLLSSQPEVSDKTSKRGTRSNSARSSANNKLASRDALLLEIKSLNTQLENLRVLYRNEVDVLLKDREVMAGERETETRKLNNQITYLSLDLQQAEAVLRETISKLLAEHGEEHEEWEKYRKNRMPEEKNLSMSNIRTSAISLTGVGSSTVRTCSSKILQTRVVEQEKLANTYHQQCKQLLEEVKKWKERAETLEKLFKEKTQNLIGDLSLMKHRYEDLDRRRLLEAEGFRTDVRLLRERLKELNRKIEKMKCEDVHIHKLSKEEDLKKSTQQTLLRAKQFEKEVAALKAKFASIIEDDPCGM